MTGGGRGTSDETPAAALADGAGQYSGEGAEGGHGGVGCRCYFPRNGFAHHGAENRAKDHQRIGHAENVSETFQEGTPGLQQRCGPGLRDFYFNRTHYVGDRIAMA